MKTTEELLYEYYLKQKIKDRNGAIKALGKRDFDKLYSSYYSWYSKTERRIKIEEVELSKLIVLFQNIIMNILSNESLPTLEVDYDEEFAEPTFYATSYLYTIGKESNCEMFAKNSVKHAMWYLNHQPNGKDAVRINNILKKLTND